MVESKGAIENANTKICPSTFVHNYCILLTSSTLEQNPFHKPLKQLNFGSPNLTVIRDSLASTADKWLRSIHVFASQNPLFSKILSFSSAWSQRFNRVMELTQVLVQIHWRDMRSTKSVSDHNFAAILPGGDSVAGLVVANGILNFLNIYNTLLIIRLVLTWFPNSPPAIVSPLSTLCDPYLNIFRGIIPPLGGTLDLSPILAFLVLNAFSSAAAALPAELPKEGSSSRPSPSSFTSYIGLTSSQEKWVRRLQGNKSTRCSNGAN